MRDVGALIWGILVVIGVISSIVQSAKKARAPARTVTPPVRTAPPVRVTSNVPPAQMPPQLQALLAQFEQQSQAVARPAAPPPPPPPPKPVPVPIAPPPPMPRAVAPRPSGVRGIAAFGTRDSLVRAIVAAEVLGKPIALRDE
ncbi:MAG: hypothetical protein JO029_00215 [Candidatus Eremiobacteraeota bacterium]|nr:hypothetical protein [Candidatus Eremiobacteraeota bacterium]MBV8432684.1 hypothetical protein [Candidatus Eremiobacteraeota bacterium]